MISSFLIAADKSGAGKTTLTTGIIRYLAQKGMTTAPFKCGPDYIDTLHLQRAALQKSYNLDTVMLSEQTVKNVFAMGCHGAHAAVIEGAMGIFDGVDAHNFRGSSAHIASVLDVPVVLTVDCAGSSFTPAAVIKGIQSLLKSPIKGVILNNIASARHAMLVRSAIETHTDAEVVGILPKNSDKLVASRHLGLKTALELDDVYLDVCAGFVEDNVDMTSILELCRIKRPKFIHQPDKKPVKKAYIAYDRAFQFYYNANIEYLSHQGFEIKYFSPLEGETPEDADFIYLGGGYPELYAQALSNETAEFIKDYAENGGYIYAECGGLMYLTKGIYGADGYYEMAGVIDASCRMCDRRQALGYVHAEVVKDCLMGTQGEHNIGHEFHYSALEDYHGEFCYTLTRITDGKKSGDGIAYKNTFASYTHLHFMSDNPLIDNMIFEIMEK